MRHFAFAAASCALLGSFAHAGDGSGPIRQSTTIPVQGLGTALQLLSKERDIHVVFISEDVGTLSTEGAQGELTVEEALKQLLRGTGLTFRHIDDDTFSIVPIAATATPTSGNVTPASNGSRTDGRDPRPDQSSPSPTRAPTLATESDGLEEVVVTAQKRQEYLLDVPISIDVLSGKDLDRSSARGLSEVLGQIGGVSILQDRPGKTRISIRGVVSPFDSVGTSPVGYYLDEVPFTFITRGELPDTNAFDLERVEVLRGPQGTLYGVNALSGVVRVLTNNPDLNAFGSKVRARVSDTEDGGTNYDGDLEVNVPLIPGELAARAVASTAHERGFIDSTADGTRDINDLKAQNYRLKVSYQPIDQLSVKLGLSRSVIDNGAPSIGFADLATPNTRDQPDKRVYNTYNLIAQYLWPSVSLISSSAYVDYNTDTDIQIQPGFGYFEHTTLHSFSEEIRLASNLNGPWQWSAGTIYKDTREPFQQLAPDFGYTEPFSTEQDSTSYAVFGETTRNFAADRFELTGGIRYYHDRVKNPTFDNFGFPLVATQFAQFNRVTGRLVATYKPTTGHMFYASAATGFRSGAPLDASFADIVHGIPALKPDSLITYELGTKGALLSGLFSYETAVYYTVWKDIQQLLITPSDLSTGINAGTAKGPGADGSIAYRPTPELTLRASLGWNDLRFADDIFVINTGDGPSQALFASRGNRLNFSPAWTGSVGGNYRAALPVHNLHAVLSANFAYRSILEERVLSGLSPLMIDKTESGIQRLLNISLGLEGGHWSAQLFGDNLLDQRQAVYPSFDQFNIFERPRTIGLQVTRDY